MTPRIANAAALAARLHAGQVDKRGVPYIEHLRAVVAILLRRWPDAPEHAVEAAWLHDAIEDGHIGSIGLTDREGVSVEAANLVVDLTRFEEIPYAEYIDRLCGRDLWAIRIKLADNEHNSDPGRAFPDLVASRYAPARAVLEAVEARLAAAEPLNRGSL